MEEALGKNKARFTHKTVGVLSMYLCCRFLRDRDWLRKHPSARQTLYFQKGLQKLDREMDIGYIIRQVRILRYFLKTVLEKDQLALLKLKSKDHIDSAENKPLPQEFKRTLHQKLLLDRYIDNLQRKTLGKQDTRLLEQLGFQDALKARIE